MESIRWRGEGGCLRTLCGVNQVEGRGGGSEDTVWSQSGGGERGGCLRTLCGVNQVEGRGGGGSEDTVWSQSGGGGAERGGV